MDIRIDDMVFVLRGKPNIKPATIFDRRRR